MQYQQNTEVKCYPQTQNISEEFLQYFNVEQIYEAVDVNVVHPFYGNIDIYQVKQTIQSKLKYEGGYPKWLPIRVATVILALESSQVDDVQRTIQQYIREFFFFNQQFVKVLAYQREENGLRIFYEFQDTTLDKSIQIRRSENRTYDASLLWKLLYSLVKSQQVLQKSGLSIPRISNNTILYNNYQEQIVGAGLIANQFQVATPQQQIQEIAETILKAGLLITDNEFQQQNISNYIQDFKRRYSSDKELLFTLDSLLNQQTDYNIQNIYENLRLHEDTIFFLRYSQLRSSIPRHYQEKYPDIVNYQVPVQETYYSQVRNSGVVIRQSQRIQ